MDNKASSLSAYTSGLVTLFAGLMEISVLLMHIHDLHTQHMVPLHKYILEYLCQKKPYSKEQDV